MHAKSQAPTDAPNLHISKYTYISLYIDKLDTKPLIQMQ